jgi:hypothetical protein
MSGDCELCFDPAMVGDSRCADCARWGDYWESLTPEGKAEEIRMMDLHAMEERES